MSEIFGNSIIGASAGGAANSNWDAITDKPEIYQGSNKYSIVEGVGSQAHGEGAHAEGTNTISGRKGFHISSVELISTENDENYNPISYTYNMLVEIHPDTGPIKFAEGDVVSLTIPYASGGKKYWMFGLDNGKLLSDPVLQVEGGVTYLFVVQMNRAYNNSDAPTDSALSYKIFKSSDPLYGDCDVTSDTHAEGTETLSIGVSTHTEGALTAATEDYAHAEGYKTTAKAAYSHSEGKLTIAGGNASHAEGHTTDASGEYSHSENQETTASGQASHAEGARTTSAGNYSHAEGFESTSEAFYSHAEGYQTKAQGTAAHSEGWSTVASNEYSHAEGQKSSASGLASHAEGTNTKAQGNSSHAEGLACSAEGDNSHAEGYQTVVKGNYSHGEGYNNTVTGAQAHGEGALTTASGDVSHAEGTNTTASGKNAHAEGNKTTASALNTHAEGNSTTASGESSHAEGQTAKALGAASHAEGLTTIAKGAHSHAEGRLSKAYGDRSHAEGNSSVAGVEGKAGYSDGAHAEGHTTSALNVAAHSEGKETFARGEASHAEGTASDAKSARSHAEGWATIASFDSQHVQGRYNEEDKESAHVVGWGDSSQRKNIHTLSTTGTAWYSGTVKVGGTSLKDAKELATVEFVDNRLDKLERDVSMLTAAAHGTIYDMQELNTTQPSVVVPTNALGAAEITKIGPVITRETTDVVQQINCEGRAQNSPYKPNQVVLVDSTAIDGYGDLCTLTVDTKTKLVAGRTYTILFEHVSGRIVDARTGQNENSIVFRVAGNQYIDENDLSTFTVEEDTNQVTIAMQLWLGSDVIHIYSYTFNVYIYAEGEEFTSKPIKSILVNGTEVLTIPDSLMNLTYNLDIGVGATEECYVSGVCDTDGNKYNYIDFDENKYIFDVGRRVSDNAVFLGGEEVYSENAISLSEYFEENANAVYVSPGDTITFKTVDGDVTAGTVPLTMSYIVKKS